jgi:hypothetical protein
VEHGHVVQCQPISHSASRLVPIWSLPYTLACSASPEASSGFSPSQLVLSSEVWQDRTKEKELVKCASVNYAVRFSGPMPALRAGTRAKQSPVTDQ